MDQIFIRFYGCLQYWQNNTRLSAKIGWILAGYIIAAIIAAASVACHLIVAVVIFGYNMQDYSGMNAFGDMLLFLAVFAMVAILPTSLMLFFLRPYPTFWRVSSAIACGTASISLVSLAAMMIAPRSVMAGLGFLTVITAPISVLFSGLFGLSAPDRNSRIWLFAAASIEGVTFAIWLISCLFGHH